MRIAIVGGSLVGPATELLLRAAGFDDVTTYERSTVAHVQSGGVMGLRPESLRILRSVGVQADDLVAIDSPDVISYELDNAGGHRFRRHDIFPGNTTSWDALHNTLADRVNVRHGWEVSGFDAAGLRFTNGAVDHPDIVIFTDGRKSTGRAALDPDRTLTYQGYMVWRGLAEPPKGLLLRGFHRYYDDTHGVLFSLTEPIKQSGLSYWEFSHNLAAGTYARLAGRPPTERAFLLPSGVGPKARAVMTGFATAHLPTAFADLVTGTTEVMGIPINDTPTPTFNHRQVGNSYGVLVGDALATVRLQAGAGLNSGLQQADALTYALRGNANTLASRLAEHQTTTLNNVLPWVELGKVRAQRSQLGTYTPTRPGYTVPTLAPSGNVWDSPEWIRA
jgi:2-polyprenyl-6-methoxyphenol hydroxylase-like FAD-dependent oxidoreductase